ncbi:MAG: FG-GAP repeat protein, partial [Verrucomicrobiota bacterium]
MKAKYPFVLASIVSLVLLASATSHAADLISSDGVTHDWFGDSVSLSGSVGLVGADYTTIGSTTTQGAAYVYRNLATASGTATQNVKLVASDGAAYDHFGNSVSLSDGIALVGAYNAKIGSNTYQGAAYVYQNLATASGTATQNVKLIASDGAAGNYFGNSVSLSGSTGLIGAYDAKVGSTFYQGAAYVYRNLATASGTATQNVKLIAS